MAARVPDDDPVEAVRAFWDGAAATFDEEPDHGLRDPAVRSAWTALLRTHLPEPPADVLDLGCGTGTLTVLLAAAGYRVEGLDLAPGHGCGRPRQGRGRRSDRHGGGGQRGRPARATQCIRIVLTRHVLWALPDPAAAVARWVRLLGPGGRMLLVEGQWRTGGGLSAEETRRLVLPYATSVESVALTDPTLWGGPISDERYLCVALPA